VGTGGALVRRFKLEGDAAAGRWLAGAMAEAWRGAGPAGFRRALLVPVPLHSRRRRRRGFDQSLWLAAELSRRLALPVATGILRRVRLTLPQGDPRVVSRERNLVGAFRLQHPDRVAGRCVVLVDDVFTSGATARHCAGLLRAAGVPAVAMLVACRS
jgi:ComF family protein